VHEIQEKTSVMSIYIINLSVCARESRIVSYEAVRVWKELFF